MNEGTVAASAPSGSASRTPPPAQASSNLLGTVVDSKYLVKGTLGRGGMGTVYEAEQLSIGRNVALKVLHAREARHATTLKRFFLEAKVAASLPHTNICQVYDYGTLPDQSPFIVMERLEGETLAERLRWEGPMRIAAAIEIACKVLSALGFAHKNQVIHRDIKPENIFLARIGRSTVPKIVDFGLSKVLRSTENDWHEEPTQLTRAGVTMGTPYYMAPEQTFGDRTIDARIDLWAMGVTLYECIAGRRPFDAKQNYQLMKSIVTKPHPKLREHRSPLPDGLEEVIDRALEKDRGRRYPSAAEFQTDLLAVLRGMGPSR